MVEKTVSWLLCFLGFDHGVRTFHPARLKNVGCLCGNDHLDFKLLDINVSDMNVGYQKCSEIAAVGLQTCGHSAPIPVTFRVPDT